MRISRIAVRATIALTAAISLAACGSSAKTVTSALSPTPRPSGTPTPAALPVVSNEVTGISIGRYGIKIAPLVLTFTEPWTLYQNDDSYLQANPGATFSNGVHQTMSIFRWYGEGVSPADNHTIVKVPDLMAWLRHNPHLKVVTASSPVTVDGEQGSEIDIVPVNPPKCAYYNDGSKCWNVLPYIDGDPFAPTAQDVGSMLVAGADIPDDPAGPVPTRLALVSHAGVSYVLFWTDTQAGFPTSTSTFDSMLAAATWQ